MKHKVIKAEIMTAKVDEFVNTYGEKRVRHLVFGKIYTNEDGSKRGKINCSPLGKHWDGSFFIGPDKLWRGESEVNN